MCGVMFNSSVSRRNLCLALTSKLGSPGGILKRQVADHVAVDLLLHGLRIGELDADHAAVRGAPCRWACSASGNTSFEPAGTNVAVPGGCTSAALPGA